MKNIKNIALIAGVIASLGISTAFAATDDTTNTHRMRDKVTAAQQAQNCPQQPMNGRHHRRPAHNGMKTLAELTGKSEEAIREECRTNKINPAQYAEKNGVYAAYKAKRLEFAKTRLDRAVTAGKLTQEKADELMKKIDQLLDDAKAGKFPKPMAKNGRGRHFGHGPVNPCPQATCPQATPAQ